MAQPSRPCDGDFMDGPVAPVELAETFSKAPLGAALRKRLNATVERLARDPQSSLPEALGTAGYKGLMRALRNPRVEPSMLFDSIYQQTIDRITPGEEILSVEDTTDLTFGGTRGRKELPRLEGKATGFRAHVALGVRLDAAHSVLGVLDLRQVVRGQDSKAGRSAAEGYADPNKESLRWPQTVQAAEQRVAGRASLIHVRDREGDDYEQLCKMATAEPPQRFVQRMRQPRLLAEPPEDKPAARKVDEAFEGLTGLCERQVALSARAQSKFDPCPAKDRKVHPARRHRNARLQFTARALEIRRPKNASKALPAVLKLNVVHVIELDVPQGEPPVEWFLLTQEPIATVSDVLRVVDIYRARWLIEEFNKALQTGCQYEKLQCETAERLWTMLAFYSPIATNLLSLRTLAHHDSQSPASQVLAPEEIEVLRASAPTRSKLISLQPNTPVTVKDALALIARLGGHFSHNGEPGWLVLLRGMVKLRERAEGLRLARMLDAAGAVKPS